MKSTPILFSAPMVTAILDGTKTQTRRIFKAQCDCNEGFQENSAMSPEGWQINGHSGLWSCDCCGPNNPVRCPYGQPGDQLWVRETYYQRGHWEPVEGVRTKSNRQKWRFVPADDAISFEAPENYRKGRHHNDPATIAWYKRLARFMPRKHSRITLQITNIRVERLQDISPDDCRAEGMPHGNNNIGVRYGYGQLWNQINGPGSWDQNPYVWVVEFKRILP